jgi:phenylacetate-CoA ligase
MTTYHSEQESMNRAALRQLQLERLQATVNRVCRNVPTYQRLFAAAGVAPEDLAALDDVGRLPFTTGDTLVENYPYGMFTVPLREVRRLHTTAGPDDAPIVLGYTANDLAHWSELTARVLAAAGVTREDVVLITFDYGLVTGAFGLHQGAERLGASVIPGANVHLDRQLDLIRDYRVTALVATPSSVLRLVQRMREVGSDRTRLVLRTVLLGSEPFSEAQRERIETGLAVQAFDSYGLGVVMGPGIAGECAEKHGLHLNEDHVLAEVVNPATGRPLPAGETGELVLTTLTKEAFPLIRYRTGDLTSLDEAPCPCGRTFARMARVAARTDDRVAVGGVILSARPIERHLREAGIASPAFQLRVLTGPELDHLVLDVEISAREFGDNMRHLVALRERVAMLFYACFRLPVEVHLVEPGSIPRRPDGHQHIVDART